MLLTVSGALSVVPARAESYDRALQTDAPPVAEVPLTLVTVATAAAGELWAKIDRALVDQAAVVPLFNRQGFDLLSKRVGNYQYNPVLGVLVGQLWVS